VNLDATIVIDLGGAYRLEMEREIAGERLRRLLEGTATHRIGPGEPAIPVVDRIRRRLAPRRATGG